jgi:hypothetical protein
MMTTQRMLQILIAALGIINLATGLALLFAPQWFFENVGNYPPFNRHYEGDFGAFVIASGIGLLWAARAPQKYRALIGVALLASALHLVNHVYDDLLMGTSLQQIISGVITVALGTALLALAFFLARQPPN